MENRKNPLMIGIFAFSVSAIVVLAVLWIVITSLSPASADLEQVAPKLLTCLYNDEGVIIIDFSETVNKDGIYVNGKTGEELGVAIELTTFDVGCPSLINRNTKIKVFR